MKCLVIQSTGRTFSLYTAEGRTITGLVKGNFRLKNIKNTNPVSVGDYVEVKGENEFWITDIYPRKNYIIRRSANLSKQAQILASNIDQICVLVTFRHPTTSFIFVDRVLATAEAYNIPAIIFFNKKDILTPIELVEQNEYVKTYQQMEYECVVLSTQHIQEDASHFAYIRSLLQNKTTLLAGNSGVGKSTLINALLGSNTAKVQSLSVMHDAGVHTTTFSQMYPIIDWNSWIIDTPGIKGFGMVEMGKEELDHYFKDIFALSKKCKYDNCMHIEETDCAVKQAVNDGQLPLSRYQSYLSMIDECTQKKYRAGTKK